VRERIQLRVAMRLQRDALVDAMRSEPDISIVGDTKEEAALAVTVQKTRPDCLVTLAEDVEAVKPRARCF
jgi:Tfp pilus assembly pilus retraction ATPase PilT